MHSLRFAIVSAMLCLISSGRGLDPDAPALISLIKREPLNDAVVREYDYSTTTTLSATTTATQSSNLTSPTLITTTSDAKTAFHVKSWPIHAALVIGAAASMVL